MSDIDHAIDKLKKENREKLAAIIAEEIMDLEARAAETIAQGKKLLERANDLRNLSFSAADKPTLRASFPGRVFITCNNEQVDIQGLIERI